VRLRVTGGASRLDRFLLDEGLRGTIGRRRLAALLAAGDVRVNGRRARKGTLVRPGDRVSVEGLPVPAPALVPTPGALALVYADERLVAADKPPGLPCTAGRTAGPTLAGMLLARCPEMARIDPVRAAGLVHRLDTGTSGLILAARDPDTYRRLRGELRRKAVAKEYLAVVRGDVAVPGTVARPLRRRPRRRSRMEPARPGDPAAWLAETVFTPLRRGGGLTLVRLAMRTGVTHQLRVHMALLGHPILGDARYDRARRARPPVSPAEPGARAPAWHYLHAAALRFDAGDLPRALGAPFPAHWRPLFARLGWPAGDPPD
jgi:23S rRNA pseudouridine1911/1915/1917 synthase